MVVQASRDIAVDEEITLNYVSEEETYEARQTKMKHYDIRCSSDLCKADASLSQ